MLSRLLTAAALLTLTGTSFAQVKYPPRPDTFHVDLRYGIRANTDERVRQYKAMTAALAALGFTAEPREDADQDPFDPTAERLSGTMPSKNAGQVFAIPQVRTAIFRSAAVPLPGDDARPVAVRLTIATGLDPGDQRLLHEQVVAQLGRLGFVENVGYDHLGFAVVRGSIPAGRVPRLLRDLRDEPSGWFLPDIPRDQLNLPLRSVLPVRAVEVLMDPVPPPVPSGAVLGTPAKATPELRTRLADPAFAGKSFLVEVVFDQPVPDGAIDLRRRLRSTIAGASLEGVIGAFAVVRVASPAVLELVAQLPGVVAVRTPRAAVAPAGGVAPADAVWRTRVGELHAAGYRGDGVRVVVLGTDFSAAAGKLPAASTLSIDLTAESSPSIEPAPAAAGVGGEVALAVRAAAPNAALALVRVDPAAFHQLATVARHALGDRGVSAALRSRSDELTIETENLSKVRDAVVAEYTQAFADLGDDDRATKRRDAAAAAYRKLQADEASLRGRVERLAALTAGLDSLAGAQVIVNPLTWQDGYPLDGLSDLSRLLDERFVSNPAASGLRAARQRPKPTWVQAAGGDGAAWAGPLLDADGNGVLEFAPRGGMFPAGTWTPELNFLGAAGDTGVSPDLPAGAKLRLTIQWREPLEPTQEVPAVPALDLTLRLLRQLDPSGATAATDELAEVARSSGPAVRILRTPYSAVYEQLLDVTLPAAGRYALRVEGRFAVAPPPAPQPRSAEVSPRVFVRPLDGAVKPVFVTAAPAAVGVGIPGDAAAALTVGDVTSRVSGAGAGVLLRVKPDVRVAGGAAAVGIAGGVAAVIADTGARPADLTRTLGLTPGAVLELPGPWLQVVPRR